MGAIVLSGRRLLFAATHAQEALMKQFKCGDVVLGCEWVTRSDDEQELFDRITVHARETHGMDEVPQEVVDQINAVITEV
jgi:predicted small metal-binding protein